MQILLSRGLPADPDDLLWVNDRMLISWYRWPRAVSLQLAERLWALERPAQEHGALTVVVQPVSSSVRTSEGWFSITVKCITVSQWSACCSCFLFQFLSMRLNENRFRLLGNGLLIDCSGVFEVSVPGHLFLFVFCRNLFLEYWLKLLPAVGFNF